MGVVCNAMAPQASNQSRDIEAPANNPEDAAIRLFALKAVVQKGEVILALAVRDNFGSAKARHQAGRL
jgi:hypothetical protein